MVRKFLLIAFFFMIGFGLSAKTGFNTIVETYNPDTSKGLIYIDKNDFKLCVYDSLGCLVKEFPIACGKNYGHKKRKGDYKTPEGVFSVQQIQDSQKWGHDFHDGKGFIKHAYGPWFIRLKTGFNGIGIHGTHAPESIGTRATEGCIRLRNEDLEEMIQMVQLGMTVIIEKDK